MGNEITQHYEVGRMILFDSQENRQNFIANLFARFLSTLIGSAVNYCFIETAIL